MPPSTSGHQRPCVPAAINPKLRTTTPSKKAYAPNNRTRTSNVRPGDTKAATPNTIVPNSTLTFVTRLYNAQDIGNPGIAGLVSEFVAAPTLGSHMRRTLHQLKRQVEHEKLRAEAARHRRDRAEVASG